MCVASHSSMQWYRNQQCFQLSRVSMVPWVLAQTFQKQLQMRKQPNQIKAHENSKDSVWQELFMVVECPLWYAKSKRQGMVHFSRTCYTGLKRKYAQDIGPKRILARDSKARCAQTAWLFDTMTCSMRQKFSSLSSVRQHKFVQRG